MDMYNLKAISIDDYGLYGSFFIYLKWYKNESHGYEMMKFACT